MNPSALRSFQAVFRAEVLFNRKRIAPYALMILFSANGLLWWAGGPAIARGWAVNSDFYIVWLCGGFSFLTMPLFIAVMMGDPVSRDFRFRVDPLIFSKPIRRYAYLLGKFCGNFCVLVGCQFCFALTPMVLQAVRTRGMIVLPPRVWPYLQHFFFFVVISSLALAAVFFLVGSLTRNVKLVYGLAVAFYPSYIAWQVFLKGLPLNWRIALDPLLFNVSANGWQGRSAEWLNQMSLVYDANMIGNRAVMLGLGLLALAFLCYRFSWAEGASERNEKHRTLLLDLGQASERLAGEGTVSAPAITPANATTQPSKAVALPPVHLITAGVGASWAQFSAALQVEFRLLRAERSLVIVAPLLLFLNGWELLVYTVTLDSTYSAAYASRTASTLLLFLFGVAVFYLGESLHRDREVGVEPLLWGGPAPDFVFLLSKFTAALLLSALLLLFVGLLASSVQLYNGNGPVEFLVYLKTYSLILFPSVILMCAVAIAGNIFLRDKYLTYAVLLGLGGAIYYFSNQGRNTWLYNPVLLNLWTPADLVKGAERLTKILVHRLYCLSLATFLLALAFPFYERNVTRRAGEAKRLRGGKANIIIILVSALLAVLTGYVSNNLLTP